MNKIFDEYEKEIEIKPIEEALKGVDLNPINEEEQKRRTNIYRNKKIIKRSTVVAVPLLVFGIFGTYFYLNLPEKTSVQRKNFSFSEIKNISKNTFKSLNEIIYPTNTTKAYNELDETFIKGFNDFAYNIFEKGKGNNNFGYSPISLYHHLDILSGLANEEFKETFSNLLGASSSLRDTEVYKNFLNNFYQVDDVGMSMYNGLFASNHYKLKDQTLDFLTKKYVEAYELSLESNQDIDLMLKWVSEKSDINLNALDLELDPSDLFYLFSTMKYVNTWNTLFLKENIKEGTFYSENNEESKVKYMRHSYRGQLADYGDYVSFYDYYKNRYKIQYIVTKDKNDKLSNLLKDKNYLIDDEELLNEALIDLEVLKFTFDNKLDFTQILSETEIGDIYDPFKNSFNEMFVKPKFENSFLKFTKQHNQIVLDENGTMIKTVTFSNAGTDSACPIKNYKIKLDHEFYYIIKDFNNIPIFIGRYSNGM